MAQRMRAAAATPGPKGRPGPHAGPPPRVGSPSDQVAAVQRRRLLSSAVGVLDEHGYAQTTVALITARARVSRRTFYELFEDREGCLVALIEDVLALLEHELEQAANAELPWRERIRRALATILAFCDREPALARVCVVHSLQGGARVRALRERVLMRLVGALDEGRHEGSRGAELTALTAEGLVGAALGILHTRLARGERQPLSQLQGELMAMIVLPYLGPAAARREQSRPPLAPGAAPQGPPLHADPLQRVPIRMTYRTIRVVEAIAAQPGVSNRMVAERAGISDAGQVSRLLVRLERLDLIENSGYGHPRGEPNAWSLTALGREVAQRVSLRNDRRRQAA
jgi:AcrR family transcriptional regulator